MSAKTGLLSALGAIIGGAGGAYAGARMAQMRPRVRYAAARRGADIEDAMVVGGATGAVVGAFIGGALGGDEAPAVTPPPVQLQR